MAGIAQQLSGQALTPVDTGNPANWWRFDFGANWQHPLGPESDIDKLDLWDQASGRIGPSYSGLLFFLA